MFSLTIASRLTHPSSTLSRRCWATPARRSWTIEISKNWTSEESSAAPANSTLLYNYLTTHPHPHDIMHLCVPFQYFDVRGKCAVLPGHYKINLLARWTPKTAENRSNCVTPHSGAVPSATKNQSPPPTPATNSSMTVPLIPCSRRHRNLMESEKQLHQHTLLTVQKQIKPHLPLPQPRTWTFASGKRQTTQPAKVIDQIAQTRCRCHRPLRQTCRGHAGIGEDWPSDRKGAAEDQVPRHHPSRAHLQWLPRASGKPRLQQKLPRKVLHQVMHSFIIIKPLLSPKCNKMLMRSNENIRIMRKVRNTSIYWTIPLFQVSGSLIVKWLDWKISTTVWSSLAASPPFLFSSSPSNPRLFLENLIKFWPAVTLPPHSVCSFGQRSGRVCWEWVGDRPCKLYCWTGSTLHCPTDFQWVLKKLWFIVIFIHRICVLGCSFSCAHALPRIWKFSWIAKKAKLSYRYFSASVVNFCEWLQRISHLKTDFLCLKRSVLRYFFQLHFLSYCVSCVSCREIIELRFGSFYSFLAFPSITPPWCFIHSCNPIKIIVDLSPLRPSNSHKLPCPFE